MKRTAACGPILVQFAVIRRVIQCDELPSRIALFPSSILVFDVRVLPILTSRLILTRESMLPGRYYRTPRVTRIITEYGIIPQSA